MMERLGAIVLGLSVFGTVFGIATEQKEKLQEFLAVFIGFQLLIVSILGGILYFHIRGIFARSVCGILFTISAIPLCELHGKTLLKNICINQVAICILYSIIGIVTENWIVCCVITPFILVVAMQNEKHEVFKMLQNHGKTANEILLFNTFVITATMFFLHNNIL